MVIGCPFTSWWIVEKRSSFSYLGQNPKKITNRDFPAYFVQFLKSLFCDLIPSSMWWVTFLLNYNIKRPENWMCLFLFQLGWSSCQVWSIGSDRSCDTKCNGDVLMVATPGWDGQQLSRNPIFRGEKIVYYSNFSYNHTIFGFYNTRVLPTPGALPGSREKKIYFFLKWETNI
jgi:hypothetical protein